jgi:hypothetical protein
MTALQAAVTSRKAILSRVNRSIENSLLQQVLLRESHSRTTGLVVALTAPHRGAGTSFLARVLADRLGVDNGGRVALLSAATLTESAAELLAEECEQERERESRSRSVTTISGAMQWNDGYRARRQVLDNLREQYQYIILDCPSIAESTDVLSVAPIADGMVIVVEAERTERRQVSILEQTLAAANGTVYGHILNKRTYAIPDWLYKRFAPLGFS